jgi:nitrate/nitrite transporter NarK
MTTPKLTGGTFSSSMPNIFWFAPLHLQGIVAGLNAGVGNTGVSMFQRSMVTVSESAIFGGAGVAGTWLQNGFAFWLCIMPFGAIASFYFLNNIPLHVKTFQTNAYGLFAYFWTEIIGMLSVFINTIIFILTKPYFKV